MCFADEERGILGRYGRGGEEKRVQGEISVMDGAVGIVEW